MHRSAYASHTALILAGACFAADTGSAGSSTSSAAEAPVPDQASGTSTTETDSSIAAALASTSSAIESLKNDVEELKTRPEPAAVDLSPLETQITTLSGKTDAVTKANDANTSRLDKLEAGDLDDRIGKLEAKANSAGSGVQGTAASFLQNAEMEADKLVSMVTHLWKQNGNTAV